MHMKKMYTSFVILIFVVSAALSQVTLTYETHALAADNLNEMKLTEWVEPGMAGENQAWDFSELAASKDFQGSIAHSYETPKGNLFPDANVELNEFGNSFYFKLTSDNLEQYGLVNNSGKLVINYDRPFVKMKYPFAYGDFFSGNYGGAYSFASVNAEIEGTYSVEADGYGSLKLPGGLFAENTLRVKTIREYDRIYGSRTTQMKVTTFRWYSNNIRFPLLVLTTMESTTNGKTFTSHQAAYRENLATNVTNPFIAGNSMNVYPNPVKSVFNLSYHVESEGRVLIEIFDNAGRLVYTVLDETQKANTYNIELNAQELGLAKGMYIVKTTVDGAMMTKQLVKE